MRARRAPRRTTDRTRAAPARPQRLHRARQRPRSAPRATRRPNEDDQRAHQAEARRSGRNVASDRGASLMGASSARPAPDGRSIPAGPVHTRTRPDPTGRLSASQRAPCAMAASGASASAASAGSAGSAGPRPARRDRAPGARPCSRGGAGRAPAAEGPDRHHDRLRPGAPEAATGDGPRGPATRVDLRRHPRGRGEPEAHRHPRALHGLQALVQDRDREPARRAGTAHGHRRARRRRDERHRERRPRTSS